MLPLFPQLNEEHARRLLCNGRRIDATEHALLATASSLEQMGVVALDRQRYVLCVNPHDDDYLDVWDRSCEGAVALDASPPICSGCGRPLEYPGLSKEVFEMVDVHLNRAGIVTFLEAVLSSLELVTSWTWPAADELRINLENGHSLCMPLIIDETSNPRCLFPSDIPSLPLVVAHLCAPDLTPGEDSVELATLLANDRLWLLSRITEAARPACTAFISYAHDDAPFVDGLVRDLESAGVAVWLDRWELKVGDSLAERIADGIRASDYLVVVLSPASVKSRWVQVELNVGLMRQLDQDRISVLPVLYRDCTIPVLLQGIRYADCRVDAYARGVEMLLATLRSNLPETSDGARKLSPREHLVQHTNGKTLSDAAQPMHSAELSAHLLDGRSYRLLTDALLQAFPSRQRLARMFRFRLDRNLDALALGESLQEIIFKVVGVADAEGWVPHLVNAARESNPGNPALMEIAQSLGLVATDLARPQLERLIRTTNSFLDINLWRDSLAKIESRVCRVEIDMDSGKVYGTGFLVGPDLLMTNYHVIEPLLSNGPVQARPEQVILRFDYKRLAGRTVINAGAEHRLAQGEWLVDAAVYAADYENPGRDELDYALLRLADAPGRMPVGGWTEPGAEPRGWIDLPLERVEFEPGSPLYIAQHPQGDALKLAIDTDAIIDVNKEGNMVRYRTNTLPGSSGSPCFDSNWRLVALHHSGDPTSPNPRFNAGTPIDAIVGRLRTRGLLERILHYELAN
jgi:hypothetical protein